MSCPDLQDGFGDTETTSEVIARFDRWAHDAAGRMTHPSSEIYDDLVQEGRIAIWKASNKSTNAVYLTKSARLTMMGIATGDRQMTGGDPTPGPRYRPKTQGADWQDEDVADSYGLLLAAVDIIDSVVLAYHRGEIAEVINSLPEQHRRFIILKYWEGMKDVEIAAITGTDRKTVGQWWARRGRAMLRERLAHLEGVS